MYYIVHGVAKGRTLLKQFSMHTCIYIYNGILFSHKKDTIMSFVVTWIGPKIIILSEVSQRKTGII